MHIAVFSHNHANFLSNCLSSINICAPAASVTVYDSQSTDKDALSYLQSLKPQIDVVTVNTKSAKPRAMNAQALQLALEQSDDDTMLFLMHQDMQLTRKVNSIAIEKLRQRFDLEPKLGFINPTFLQGRNRERDEASMVLAEHLHGYVRNPSQQSSGVFQSESAIVIPKRLKALDWNFRGNSRENEIAARQLFDPMLFLLTPFAMWLPSAPKSTQYKKTWAIKRAEVSQGFGFHPYKTMSKAEVDIFRSRDTTKPAFAEDWLQLKNAELDKPWAFNALQTSNRLKLLHKLTSWG